MNCLKQDNVSSHRIPEGWRQEPTRGLSVQETKFNAANVPIHEVIRDTDIEWSILP